ncbi:hypothetical protein [Deefgea salmonis]|uniref:Uncharacterized protein n=1 Tax=Deefgea salmonis TaxID=2875502 RepID=A0ABS8BNR0_9NEIS|nr:hypothetical protein [Deefgea salmonis]MCB5197374.1 hypothetical protein [Deefgea salmonis]
MKSKGKRLIIVLGMHRSGTSAITRALNILGVELGDRLLAPMEGVNSKGFFEDIDINELNIEILKVLGRDWDSLSLIDLHEMNRLDDLGYIVRAENLLCQKTINAEVFGFKDPRVAVLLRFWNEAFERCGLDVSYIIAIRNPLSVAQSLAKRDGFSFEKSYLLWLVHVINSLEYTQKKPSLIIDYDYFLSESKSNIDKIADFFGLQVNKHELREYQQDFIEEGLRHNKNSVDDLMADEQCPPVVQDLYLELLNVARTSNEIDIPIFNQNLIFWMHEFDKLKVNFRLLDQYLGRINSLKKITLEQDDKLYELIKELVDRDPAAFKSAFDYDAYLRINTDVATAGVDAYQHFVNSGVVEKRAPAKDLYLFIKDGLSNHLQELNLKLIDSNRNLDEQLNKLIEVEAACSLTVLETQEAYHQFENKLQQELVEQIKSQHSQIDKNCQQIDSFLLRLAEREKEFAEQVVAIQQVHEQQNNEQSIRYSNSEENIARQLEQLQQEIESSLVKSAEQEKIFHEKIIEQQKIYENQKKELIIKHENKEQMVSRQWENSQLQIQNYLREMLEQERVFSVKLNELQQKNEFQIEGLNNTYALNVQNLQDLLEQAREQIKVLTHEQSEKERLHAETLRCLSADFEKQKNDYIFASNEREKVSVAELLSAHSQIEAQMIDQVNREQIYSKKMQEIQKKHEEDIVKQSEAHTLREQELVAQLEQANKMKEQQLLMLIEKENINIERIKSLSLTIDTKNSELNSIYSSYYWRWTYIFRKVAFF